MPAALAGGFALPPGSITSAAASMLVIFLGLVSASVLPAVSLLVNSMAAAGRSVLAINELKAEIELAMDALFLLFGCVAVVVSSLVALATPPPRILSEIPMLTTEILPRLGQGVVVVFSSIIILRMGHIPALLRRALGIRHDIALEEARRQTLENAPAPGSAEAAFPTHPEFGKTVLLEDSPPHKH